KEVLQLEEVLTALGKKCVCSLGKEAILNFLPAGDYPTAVDRLELSRDILKAEETNRLFSLGGLSDVGDILDQAKISGSVIEPEYWPRIIDFLEVCHKVHLARPSLERDFPRLAREISPVEPEPGLLE